MRKTLLLAALCLPAGPAMAGWYHVENFTGTVAGQPVHFSIQSYASFGAGTDTEGSYYYDSRRIPITLYGRHEGGKLMLCEITDAKTFDRVIDVGSKTPLPVKDCAFTLDAAGTALTGSWRGNGKSAAVSLTRVGVLDDTGTDGKIDGNVEIPYWGQTAKHAFLGDYVLAGGAVCLDAIKAVDKKSGVPFQTIAFDKDDCQAGLLMTPIYMNVQEQTDKRGEAVIVNYADGRAGHSETWRFNPKAGKYVKSGS